MLYTNAIVAVVVVVTLTFSEAKTVDQTLKLVHKTLKDGSWGVIFLIQN